MAGPSGDLTPGELSRRVQELLLQFEALLRKVEDRYVQKETLELIREGINIAIQGLQEADKGLERSKVNQNDFAGLKTQVDNKVDKAELAAVKSDVDDMKDTLKWIFRIVGAFVVTAVLAAAFTAGGGLPQ